MRSRPNTLLASIGILVMVLLGGDCTDQNPTTPASTVPHQEEEMRRVTVDLSAVSWIQTRMLVLHANPPPWPRGNHLMLGSKTNLDSGLPPGEWMLLNMHAENYAEMIKRGHFKTLEFGLMPDPDHRCFVVDSRVPREWLLAQPFLFEVEERLFLKTRFPNLFRNNPVADSLAGTKWVLVARDDPGGLAERVLPGEKLRFGVTNLLCEAVSGIRLGERLWELQESPESLCVYEVLPREAYTGASFGLTRAGDELVLVPTGKLSRSGKGYVGETYGFQTKTTYRREP